jgi:hypothetical protein
MGSHQFGFHICLGAQGSRQISGGWEDFASSSAVFLTLSEGFKIELPDHELENATLNGNHPRQVVEIVIECVPTVLQIHFMGLFMSLGRILLESFIVTNLFDPVRHQVDHQTVEVSI